MATSSDSVPVPCLVSVPVPLVIAPATLDAPPTLIVMAPPPVVSLPIVATPVLVILRFPPAVVIVLAVSAIVNVPPAEKVTEPLFAFRFRLPSVVNELIVMLFDAVSTTFAFAPSASILVSEIVVVPLPLLAVTAGNDPSPVPAVAPSVIVMLVGSSNKDPVCPRGALASTLASNTRNSLPDTSTWPPFPPEAPPRAEIVP